MYLRLPGVLVEGRFPSSSEAEKTAGTPEPSMPGGDALVMWAPGGAGSDTRTRDGNREHALDELSSDASSVEAVLATMEDDWRNLQEHFAAGPPGVTNSVAYLTSQVDRIAQTYSEFPDQAADVQQLRNRLAVVTGLVETPLRGADCFDCGVPLLREYGETGLVDDWTCPGCRREYTQAEYWLAVRAELEEVRGA